MSMHNYNCVTYNLCNNNYYRIIARCAVVIDVIPAAIIINLSNGISQSERCICMMTRRITVYASDDVSHPSDLIDVSIRDSPIVRRVRSAALVCVYVCVA